MPIDFQQLRHEYTRDGLSEADADADAIRQFERWFEDAIQAGVQMPEAMTLATATSDGIPSARAVLLKEVDVRGFSFYTNLNSHKGRNLAENPHAALNFMWRELERQVRIRGFVERVTRQEAEQYWATRPRGSQLAALISAQSEPVSGGREALEKKYAEIETQYEGRDVALPDNWGGYRVRPAEIEFWQGRINRLHDRLLYKRVGPDPRAWSITRLQP